MLNALWPVFHLNPFWCMTALVSYQCAFFTVTSNFIVHLSTSQYRVIMEFLKVFKVF